MDLHRTDRHRAGSYTATACTNVGMTTNCVGPSAITSGANLTGLTQGTGYYVTVETAVPPAGYVSGVSAAAGPSASTVQLTAPTGVTLAYGTVAGSIKVTFTAPGNAAAGQPLHRDRLHRRGHDRDMRRPERHSPPVAS